MKKFNLKNIKFEILPVPEQCDHMTIECWKSNVKRGGFIDYDGYGDLATETECSNIEIYPSQAFKYEIPEWATHICWYNK
jgi:hypothetical protein